MALRPHSLPSLKPPDGAKEHRVGKSLFCPPPSMAPTSSGVKVQVLACAQTALSPTCPHRLPLSLSLILLQPIQASTWFLQHSSSGPASGPLHMLCLLPGPPFPRMSVYLAPFTYFGYLLKCHLLTLVSPESSD